MIDPYKTWARRSFDGQIVASSNIAQYEGAKLLGLHIILFPLWKQWAYNIKPSARRGRRK
jgi:hypothetical protein